MQLSLILSIALSASCCAHPDPRDVHAGLPKLVGGRSFVTNLKERLKERNVFTEAVPAVAEESRPVDAGPQLESRSTQICGLVVGSCDTGYCCSSSGFCGKTSDYCAAPDCQFQYGPACDANKVPVGTSTSSIPRPRFGSIPYGGINAAGVQDCIKNNVIAFTYDDGPYLYTKDLLDLLDSYGAKATFFITGNNLGKGQIDDCNTGYPQLIKRMYNSGHQVASHTWSHQDLSLLTTTQFNNQIYYNEMAFRNILGVIPTYLRPPYSSCGITCSNSLKNMGYHVTYFDLDTEGYLNDNPVDIQKSKDIYTISTKGIDPTLNDFLLVEHDIHYQTVYNLTKFMLDTMKTQGWGPSVTVGECLGDPVANWYRPAGNAVAACAAGIYTGATTSQTISSSSIKSSASSASTAAPATDSSVKNHVSSSLTTSKSTKATDHFVKSSTSSPSATASSSSSSSSTVPTTPQTISTDATCGNTITCLGSSYGNCCSQYGYCGSTSIYCGTGCQSAFGVCGFLSSSSPTTSSSTVIGSSTLAMSTDASCGGAGMMTCSNSVFGSCCSQYGWCGSSALFCGVGCQSGFGTCS